MMCTPSTAFMVPFVIMSAGLFADSDAHQSRGGWTYPQACCKSSDAGGDCQAIPGSGVRKGRHGFSVYLHRGDHRLVTRNHLYFIPYGDEIPSGDGDFHICLHPTEDHVNCFFAPPDGA